MSRGADRQDIFSDDHDRTHFEQLLGEATEAYSVGVHAYCLMGNHFHLLVHFADDELSSAMQHVCGNHARSYNQRHGRSGSLFGDRFNSVPITSEDQLLAVVRYIHRNPLDLVSLRALPAYRWSSLGPYLGLRPPPTWLRTRAVATLLGDRDHRRFVEDPLPSDSTPANGRPAGAAPSLEQLERSVARGIGTTVDAIRQIGRGAPNPARMLVVTLALELRIQTAEELAAHYGLDSTAAVRVTARRGRVRVHDDAGFRRLRDRVVSDVLPGGQASA